jgi:simple sugar transport system substrate-binding protein
VKYLNYLWLVILTLGVAACQAATPTPAETPAATTEAAAGTGAKVEKVAVLLPASQTDQGWNQQAADAMTQVQQKLGFELEVAENLGYDDITPVLRDLAERDFDLLICHASGYQTVCPEFAQQTKINVAVVENPGAVGPYVADVETQAQEVAYLAGILAAKLSAGKKVGIVVSGEPPTWNFMTIGFAEGVKATDPAVEIIYSVIGEAAYEDAAGAKRVTESQLAAGADIIFGMGDGASFGMLQAVQKHNAGGGKARFIDVIGDKSADYKDVLLTSVVFDYTGVYEAMIGDITAGTFGKEYRMDVAGGGVRLLDLPADVPADVAAAVEQARQDIVSGKIKVSAIGDVEAMRARLDELNQ